MTSDECAGYVTEILSDSVKMRGLDISSPFTDVFRRDIDTGMIECGDGFDKRYEKTVLDGGRYPTRGDINNIFASGINYGKLRAFGMRSFWDAMVASVQGGYAKGAVVRDSNGRKFISQIENNQAAIPADGKSNRYWNRVVSAPRFIGNNIDYATTQSDTSKKTTLAFIKLDAELPTKNVTEKFKIATFTGSQLSSDMNGTNFECSGMVLFSNFVCWGPLPQIPSHRPKQYIAGLYYNADTITESWELLGGATQKVISSSSLKLSPYPDLYTNAEHENEFIEVASHRLILWNDGEYAAPRSAVLRSPCKAVPIQKDKTYHLYIEYENAAMGSFIINDSFVPPPSPAYLEVYPFTRALDVPRVG